MRWRVFILDWRFFGTAISTTAVRRSAGAKAVSALPGRAATSAWPVVDGAKASPAPAIAAKTRNLSIIAHKRHCLTRRTRWGFNLL